MRVVFVRHVHRDKTLTDHIIVLVDLGGWMHILCRYTHDQQYRWRPSKRISLREGDTDGTGASGHTWSLLYGDDMIVMITCRDVRQMTQGCEIYDTLMFWRSVMQLGGIEHRSAFVLLGARVRLIYSATCRSLGIREESALVKVEECSLDQRIWCERTTRLGLVCRGGLWRFTRDHVEVWAEAVNTACYVQNRVLVIKPHNKTHYELFLGSGPNWLFDIDALTNSINYKPVVVGNQSNGNAGTKACDDAGKARMETESLDARFKPSGEEEKMDTKDPGNENAALGKDSEVPSIEEPREDQRVNQELDASINSINSTNNINTASDGNNTNNVNAVSLTVNVVVIEVNVVDKKTSIELLNDPKFA
ncbi:hypothetical protein Tco_0914474 [Tanacetum coccineum]